MWTLILTLLSSSGLIIEVNLHTEAPSQQMCNMDMPNIVKYMEAHPDKQLVKWHCEDVNKLRTPI